MALYLHSSHLKFGFIAKSWLPVCFSFYRVFFVVIWHNAGYDYLRRQMRAHTALGQCTEHECYGIGITILQTNAKLVHNGCTILHVFLQCSRKAPETQNSQRYRFPFVMLVSHVLPNSEHFPHWWQLLCSCSCSLPPLQVSGGQTVSRQQAGGFYLDPDSRWLRSVLDTSSQFPFPVGSHVRMWALREFRGCDVSKWLLWLVFTNI